jgi:phosphoglycolate phosphatase-like HAD superfamily hydrolase
MLKRSALVFLGFAFLLAAAGPGGAQAADDPLPSWNATGPKKAIVSFVEKVTKHGSAEFVPPERRIAVFDNDGTLWAEQPIYFQLAFALDRVKALASQHPEWKTQEPFAALLKGDLRGALAGGEKSIGQIMAVSHAGMTVDEFDQIVRDWFKTARHPKTGKRYSEMVYQPMVELLAYLRANGFKTFIVSGGGVDFMRAFAPAAYGIPPDQIVGSMGKLRYDAAKAALIKLPEIDFIDDKEGKPIGIQKFIGQRPVLAFGNSDGDRQMLEFTAAGSPPRLMGLVHHTDAAREWAYDRDSRIGTLGPTLDEANAKGWIVVDIKRDWNRVFPGDRPAETQR